MVAMQKEYDYTGKAMGTDFSIAIVSNSEEIARTLSTHAIATIRAYEARFSRFLSDSELSRLNAEKSLIVSDTFFDVILEAERLFTLTKGVFNPLVQIGRFGYNKNFEDLTDETIPTHEETYDIDFSETTIDRQTRRITLLPGQRLDFGGFLKGYLATRLAREIKDHPSVNGVIVNIGGDIHTRGVDAAGNIFTFSIYNPVTQTNGPSVPLKDTSLATSGTYKRSWRWLNKRIHHILDPSGTHNPDTDIVSASAIHPEGGVAEALTKVLLSVGPEKAREILADTPFSYIVISKDGNTASNII